MGDFEGVNSFRITPKHIIIDMSSNHMIHSILTCISCFQLFILVLNYQYAVQVPLEGLL